ncbi:MAG: ABC transporter permease [Chloroflexi bacterium]|nr:MAG: ABC transporter permease [Chloroflexota bacterium]
MIASRAFLAILRRDIVVTGREFIAFLLQVLLQPLFFLFIFGKVLPSIGFARTGFAAILLPGIVALTVVTTALQGVTLPLVLDLGFAREIDDRLLAPLPVSLVAVEKVIFAAMRGLVAGAIIFPLAYWILGNEYNVRGDAIGTIIGIMVLTAFAGASLGLTIGTLVKPEQIGLMFSLIFTPLIFTGCTYYPWASLDSIRWFQIVTLFNPMTYASEGLRFAMVPAIQGHTLPTLAMGWVILGLSVTFVAFLFIGIRTFRRRVVS